MTSPAKPVKKHLASAREHLAGLKAAAAFQQDLSAAHLLKSQQPISDTPYPAETEGTP